MWVSLLQNNNYIDTEIVPIKYDSIVLYLSVTVPFAHPSVIMKRSFLETNDIKYGISFYTNAEDYAMWCNLYGQNARFGNLNEFLFKYREFNQSLSKTNRKKIFKDRKDKLVHFLINIT